MAWGCRTGPPAYVAWRASTTTLCPSRLFPQVRGLRIWLQVYERAPLSALSSGENKPSAEEESAAKEPEKEKPAHEDTECDFFRVGDLGRDP
jgi:hypothetical protein